MKRRATAVITAAMIGILTFSSTAVAAENVPTTYAEGDLDNLVMNKATTLEDDGTYTIKLEAYAKGNVSTTTVKQVVPTDVILVLDQSGSMVQESITGIPGDTYVEANPTNAELVSGDYYYKVDDSYYRVTATKELVSSSVEWLGQDGKTYKDEELSTSWTASNGNVYNTATPFVTSTLKTYTRNTKSYGLVNNPHFINDNDSSDDVKGYFNMNSLREAFTNKKKTDSTTVSFHNDIPDGVEGWTAQDPYYVAVVYTAVTKQEVNKYRYTYTYTDENGKVITIGTSESATETVLDGTTCTVTPLYTRETTEGTRLKALQYAANRFINSIRTNAIANGVDHRVAVVGFASDEYEGSNNQYYYANTELFVGQTQYNYAVNGKESTYNTSGNLAENHYSEAFQNVRTDAGYNNLIDSVDVLAGLGGTHPSLGFEMANGIFAANDANYVKPDGSTATRNRIIIFLTDGTPGDSGYDSDEASSTVNKAAVSKETYNARVYTVAVLDDASTGDSNVDTFLKNTSSSNSYTLATSTAALDNFFQTIDKDISSTETNVTLSESAYVVDRLSDYFVIPNGFTIDNNVTVQIAKHAGDEAFNNPTDAPSSVTASLSTDSDGTNRGIVVQGFNFVSSDNLVTTSVSEGGSTVANGNKLVITISGLLAKDEAAIGTYIDTNNSSFSGIWDKDDDGSYGMIKAFPVPHTMLDKKLFVLDYAKEASLDVHNATKLDSIEDGLFSQVGDNNTSLSGKYGTISSTSGLKYTPNTMKWDGYDTFYALGKDNEVGDAKTKNIWSKVSVIPANNVYYEDSFITDTTNGTVGIAYSDDWKTVGSSVGNVETPNDGEHGWITDLADDATYSDGSAQYAGAGATATFTFTGTGVDIYSRTNLKTGMVRAQLYKGESMTASAMSKSLVVDNLAQSGDYYQIPTVSFYNLEYGTYTVKLTVGTSSTSATGEARSTYYLDGIRVYNPLSDETEADATVSEAYGDEIGAIFREVRELLLAAESLEGEMDDIEGVVFIDYNPEDKGAGNASTATISTYEDYGPKNEVYLAKDQAIAFAVVGGEKYAVGLKAPNGLTTTQVTNGENTSLIEIAHASDLYYEITPNENDYVIIKNTGDQLLSITKLKTTGSTTVEEVATYSLRSMMLYADTFDSLPVVDYVEEPEITEPSTPDVGGDVVIDNPEEEESTEDVKPVIEWLNKLFDPIRKFLGRF